MRAIVACCVGILAAMAASRPVQAAETAASSEALRRYAQGRLAEERGDHEQALSEYYRALILEPKAADIARRVSELSARTGDTERSLEFADRSLALEPDHPRGLWLKGAALFNLGRPVEALPWLEKAATIDSTDSEILRALARIAEQLDRVDLVARANGRVVELEPEDGESWFQLATARARLMDWRGAQAALDRAVEINPLRPGILFVRGWVKESLGENVEAIELYRHHLDVHAADHVSRRRLVNLLVREQRLTEAHAQILELVRAAPKDPDLLEVQADLEFKLGRSARGIEVLQRMERDAASDPEAVERVVLAYVRQQRKEEANRLADRWKRDHAGDCRATMLQARARALTGAEDPALELAEQAVAECPDSLGPRVLLGRLYQDRKRFADAEKQWAELAAVHPDHIGIALDLAFCREQTGDVTGAQTAARNILRRYPEHPAILNFLGYLLADHNRDLEEALALIDRALRHDPDNGAFIDSRGWAYYRLGRLDEARKELEKAVRLTDGDPVVHEHLGDVYNDLKLFELAKEQYRKSLSRDGSNQRVRGKLSRIR